MFQFINGLFQHLPLTEHAPEYVEYITTYHRHMPEEDMLGFIKWAIDREGISCKLENEDMDDPIMLYFRNQY